MTPIITPFVRGGREFEAILTDRTCSIKDTEEDSRFGLRYKFIVKTITINVDESPSVRIDFAYGLESPTGELVEKQTGSWSFSGDHPDLQDMIDAYGESFMKSCVNGFIKHFMKSNPLYTELESEFSPLFDDDGNVIAENED